MEPLVVFLVILAAASASDVLEYTDSDFNSKIKDHDIALVEFFAPWCGHCKRLAPEYETAATTLKNADPPVPLIKVDCTANTDTCQKYGVSGYPTLKIFKGGEIASDYQGPREAKGIVAEMKKKAGPVSKLLDSVEVTKKFLNNEDHSVVGFFASEGSDLQKFFAKAADSLSDNFRFAHTTEKSVLEEYGFSDDIVIFQPPRLVNKQEGPTTKYDGDATVFKIKSWIADNIHGIAGHRTQSNMDQFKQPLVVAYYNVDYKLDTKGSNYWRNRVIKVAKKLKGADRVVNFAVSSNKEFMNEIDEYGLEKSGDKPVVGARDSKGQKFVMKDEFSMDNLEKFVNDMLDGKLKPHIKSEPVPDSNDGPVKVVVGETFEEIVNDPTKDVLIEFYAPWCGHCKSLAPKYEELGEKLSKESNIVIAKMDATANDVPAAYSVQGFPTMYFAPKGSKDNPKKYEGGREVDDFIKYIAKEATDPLEGFDKKGKKKKIEL